MDYGEEAELTRYVLRHHRGLLSPFEEQVELAARARDYLRGGTNKTQVRTMEQFARLGDPEIDHALSGGLEASRLAACRRIQGEHADLRVNRCPRCHRVARTPLARQCFWCGHDWHG